MPHSEHLFRNRADMGVKLTISLGAVVATIFLISKPIVGLGMSCLLWWAVFKIRHQQS